jgi:RecA-family ATPase
MTEENPRYVPLEEIEGAAIYDDAAQPEEPPGFFNPAGEGARPAAPAPAPLEFIYPHKFLGLHIDERKWIVKDWIPCGVVTAIYGDGGVGKSLAAQQLQTAAAMGAEWAGQMVEPVKSIGFYCEDEADELLRRQARINRLYACDKSSLENTRFVSRLGLDNLLMTFDARGRGETTAFQKQIVDAAIAFGARLVIFDTASDGFAGNENDRPQVRQFVSRALGSIATAINGAVVLCAHPSRSGLTSGEGDGGSTGWSNTVRSRLYLSVPKSDGNSEPDANARILSRKKANYAARNDEVKLLWNDGVFVVDSPSANIYRPHVDDVFLNLLDAATAEERRVSHSVKAPNFAPRMFQQRPDRQGYREADFFRAMERLFANKKIRAHEEGPPSRRRSWIVRWSP